MKFQKLIRNSISFLMLITSIFVLKPIPAQQTANASTETNTVILELFVTAPDNTPADETLFIAGSLIPPIGEWKSDGAALTHIEDGRHHIRLELPKGETLEFKFTRGSWETVEKDENFGEVENRVIELNADQQLDITIANWRDQGEELVSQKDHTLTGAFQYLHEFHSEILDNERTLIVYLPPGYPTDRVAGKLPFIRRPRRYPVLYMHDGQNIFDAHTSFIGLEWQADETADRLITDGLIEPIIIVGIYNNSKRIEEYTTGTNEKYPDTHAIGEKYARFVVEEVKPFIDKKYRTLPDREHTATAGSSLGGIISYIIATRHPDVFSKAALVSPSLQWNDRQYINNLPNHIAALKRLQLWIDAGTKEGRQIEGENFNSMVVNTRLFVDALHEAGLAPGKHYYYLEVPGGKHDESYFGARLDKILIYFFGR